MLLSKTDKIAFIMSPRLGDSLLSMIVVHNLQNHGFQVDVFGDYMYALKDWFTDFQIHSLPTHEVRSLLEKYDVLLYAYPNDILAESNQWHPRVVVFDKLLLYRQKILMPDIQVAICRDFFNLPQVVRTNGLKPLKNLQCRRFKNRIVIHPTSHELRKNWLPTRFLKLAKRLAVNDYEIHFIVSASERKDWQWLENEKFSLPEFENLSALAAFIYESGYFIGNDSGIGHLASNLGLPTLTFAMRKRVAMRWRPSFAPNITLFPPKWFITRPLKEKYWQYAISVNRAFHACMQLKLL